MVHYNGLEALRHILDYGIKVIGAYESGAAIASGSDYAKAFTAETLIQTAFTTVFP
jgi:hypothetical protein